MGKISFFLILITFSIETSAQKTYRLSEIPPQYVKPNETLILKITHIPNYEKLTLAPVRENLSGYDIQLSQDNTLTYKPSVSDHFEFKIGLKYGKKTDTLSITPYHKISLEYDYVQNQNPLPSVHSSAYSEIQSSNSAARLIWNHDTVTTRKIAMIGTVIVFEPISGNKYFNELRSSVHDSMGNRDIESLAINCDSLIFRTKMWLPQTNISIKCNTIVFYPASASDGAKTIKGFLVTTPIKYPSGGTDQEVGENGNLGLPGGNITINCKNIINYSGEKVFFVANGGKGQTGGPGKDGLNITEAIGKEYRGDSYDFGRPGVRPYIISNVIYEEDMGRQVIYGSKLTVPKRGGDATLPGFGGQGGEPGKVYLSVENIASIGEQNIENSPGENGDVFGWETHTVRIYKGGEGQHANWITGGGPPYPRDPCNNCIRVLQTLILTEKQGESGKTFPTPIPKHFKSYVQYVNIQDSVKLTTSHFRNRGLTSSDPIFKDTNNDGYYDSCIIIGHFWYDDGNPLGFPETEDKQIGAFSIIDNLERNADNLNDVRYYYKYLFLKPYFDSLEGISSRISTPIIVKDQTLKWLSPAAARKELVYIKDTYMSGNFAQTSHLLENLISYLKNAIRDTASESYNQLSDALVSANAILYRVISNLDYFGNPAGFCPLLSFWINKLLYVNALDESIHNIILSRRILKLQHSMQLQGADMEIIINNTWTQIEEDRSSYANAMSTLSGLSDEAENIAATIRILEKEIQAREEGLLRASTDQVALAHQVPAWKKAGHILAIACKVIPVYQPALAVIGEGVDLVTRYDDYTPFTTIEQAENIYERLSSKTFKESAKNMETKLNEFKRNGRDVLKYGKDIYKEYNERYAPAFSQIMDAAKENEVDAKEVMDMLEKIKQEDTVYSKLAKKVQDLTERKVRLMSNIKEALNVMSTLQSDISSKLVKTATLEAFRRALSTNSLSNDAKSMLKSIEEDAFDDLLTLRYNMSKSYEYRFLKPFADRLSFQDIFNEIDNFLSIQNAATTDSLLIAGVKGIYMKKLRQILREFVSKMSQERFTYTNQTIDFSLSKSMIATLNEKGSVDLQLPKDIIDFIGSTSSRTFSLLDNISVKNLQLEDGQSTSGNVNINTFISDNTSIIGYKNEKKLFRLGNGNTPILFSTCSYSPSSPTTYHNSSAGNDVNDFLTIAGITPASIGDGNNFSSFFNKPSLQSNLHVEKLTMGVKLKSLTYELNYGFIPINNLKTIQILTKETNLLYIVANQTSGTTLYFTGEINKVFLSTDRIKIIVPKYFNNKQFVHWEDNTGTNNTNNEYDLPQDLSYVTLKPVYR